MCGITSAYRGGRGRLRARYSARKKALCKTSHTRPGNWPGVQNTDRRPSVELLETPSLTIASEERRVRICYSDCPSYRRYIRSDSMEANYIKIAAASDGIRKFSRAVLIGEVL